MKQNNYTKLTAVYTGIALANLIAVFCVLRRRPDPLFFFSLKMPHWLFLGLAVLIVPDPCFCGVFVAHSKKCESEHKSCR